MTSPLRLLMETATMTEPLTFFAALLAGLLGSAHCVGMCGPLAALPQFAGQPTNRPPRPLQRTLSYNAGRLLSYTLMGAIVGGVGQTIGNALQISTWALILRTALGAALVLIGLQLLLPRLRSNPLTRLGEKVGAHLWRQLAPIAQRLRRSQTPFQLLGLGVLWGWLPCGLVYSLLLMAAVAGSSTGGALTMLGFGLGTLPAMVGIGLAGGRLANWKQHTLRPVAGALLMISGVWLAAMPLWHQTSMSQGEHQHHHHH